MVTDNETLDKVYTAENHEELMDAYKDWAGDYDADTVGAFGYVAHVETAKAFSRAMKDKSAAILDAGAGTGLVGEELKKRGYEKLDALDYSREMLEEAEKKDIYRKLFHADMSKPLDIADDRYHGIVCTGTFTFGHVDADAFDELVRITRPEGVICFTIREGAYEEYGYRKRMIELERREQWELLSMVDTDYLKNEGVACKLCTYRVAPGAAYEN